MQYDTAIKVQPPGPATSSQDADKAPSEDVVKDQGQFTQQTQKGKKVDGDPSQESDQPIEQDI